MKYSYDGLDVNMEAIAIPDYNAEIDIGGTVIILHREKPFTKRQIKHIEKYFGFKARNL